MRTELIFLETPRLVFLKTIVRQAIFSIFFASGLLVFSHVAQAATLFIAPPSMLPPFIQTANC